MSEQAPQSISQDTVDRVMSEAVTLKQKHDQTIHTKNHIQPQLELEQEMSNRYLILAGKLALGQEIQEADKRVPNLGNADLNNELLKGLVEDQNSRVAERQEALDRIDTERKASLYDAIEHKTATGNQEVYEQAAINDATAAGHDITFGGQQFPAQPPVEAQK